MSNRAGNALRELGVEMEDRVLIVLPDCPEFVWTWFGAARIGAVITMVNPLLPAEDYQYYLDYTRARVAVIHESLLKTFNEAAAERETSARGSGCRWTMSTSRRRLHERARCFGSLLTAPFSASRTNARPPIRIATTSRSGCLLPARPAIQKAPCICNTICLSTPKSLPNARWALTKTI